MFLIIFFGLSFFKAQAQETNKYIIYFKDKPLEKNVEQYFSKEAIEFRKKFNISFDERDYPVNANYVEQIKDLKAVILNQSNWLNAVLISADQNSIAGLQHLDFVTDITKVEKANKNGIASVDQCEEVNGIEDFEDNYGSSFPQVHLLNGEYLHEQGFNGENMTISICDNGFPNANNNPGFSHIFNENRILGTYDYVNGDSSVYGTDDGAGHGSNCFSFIGGLASNQYIGNATKANFYLFHTEKDYPVASYERLEEEFNLATALERCTQLGVKVVSISLGYNTFDVASENHDTTDMKTSNTPAAKAVNMAVSKGLIVCVAAGNSNDGPYITSPACADSSLAIASVDINGNYGGSSIGIIGDNRIKPNIACVGKSAKYIDINGNIGSGGGTSYATPQIAGLSACLWQAFPDKTAWQIKTAIEQSASQYQTPDKRVGYGIPDFKKAYQLLSSPNYVSNSKLESEIILFPNPINDYLVIQNKSITPIQSVEVFNQVGQLVLKETDFPSSEKTVQMNNNSSGMFLLRILMKNGDVFTKKIIKE